VGEAGAEEAGEEEVEMGYILTVSDGLTVFSEMLLKDVAEMLDWM
jgi:hypothetical protein